MMDYEKPEAVIPQIVELTSQQGPGTPGDRLEDHNAITPDPEVASTLVEEIGELAPAETRGENLW
jgi:hypothetical protein